MDSILIPQTTECHGSASGGALLCKTNELHPVSVWYFAGLILEQLLDIFGAHLRHLWQLVRDICFRQRASFVISLMELCMQDENLHILQINVFLWLCPHVWYWPTDWKTCIGLNKLSKSFCHYPKYRSLETLIKLSQHSRYSFEPIQHNLN